MYRPWTGTARHPYISSATQLIAYTSVTAKLSDSPKPVSRLRYNITTAMDGLDKAHVEVCDRCRKVDNTCRSPGKRHTDERYPCCGCGDHRRQYICCSWNLVYRIWHGSLVAIGYQAQCNRVDRLEMDNEFVRMFCDNEDLSGGATTSCPYACRALCDR